MKPTIRLKQIENYRNLWYYYHAVAHDQIIGSFSIRYTKNTKRGVIADLNVKNNNDIVPIIKKAQKLHQKCEFLWLWCPPSLALYYQRAGFTEVAQSLISDWFPGYLESRKPVSFLVWKPRSPHLGKPPRTTNAPKM
jgi:hypothetical protein